MKKFTMDDVDAAHALKPYLAKKKFLKFFGYLNFKISKGWNRERITKLIELTQSENQPS